MKQIEVHIGGKKFCNGQKTTNPIENSLGLMFKKELGFEQGLLIKLSESFRILSSIHSFFMRFTIDLIFIDSERKVVDLKTLKPWRIYVPKKGAKYVLEVEKGAGSDIQIGDEIQWNLKNY